jgi:predicted nucleotide-binding protein
MTERFVEKARELIAEGNTFTYNNFWATKTDNGYPSSFSSKYIAWKTKVESLITATFGKSSPIFETFKAGDAVHVLRNGEDKFKAQQATITGALIAGIDAVEFEPVLESAATSGTNLTSNNKVFVVHGHDEQMKSQLEIFLTELGLEPIVLHRKADEGLTIIEKFEKHSDVGYAFILLTPDDIGYHLAEESKPDLERKKETRARQNVIFEFGYFVAKLGRQRVCCLYREGVTLPTDVSGIIYKRIHNSVEEAAFSILKDLKAVGYQVAI